MRYVIIGNSVAALNACREIRELDKEGPITIISAERHYAYGRPLISYWLAGKVDSRALDYVPQSFYSEHNIAVLLGRRAVRLHPAQKAVELDDGSSLPYDRLLVATGGRPLVPPLEGLGPGDYFTFLTYDDVVRLAEVARPGAEAVVLGGGPSALKAAESLVQRGVRVTLVELASRIWPAVLDEEASSLAVGFLREKGVEVVLGDTVRGGRRDAGGRLLLEFRSGTACSADFLVVAVGVRPNTELLEGIPGVKLAADGVVVDRFLNIGIPDVYAAGDVVAGSPPLLPHAALQGRLAGRNMAGAREEYKPVPPYNALGFLGFHVVSIGVTSCGPGEGYEVVARREGEWGYRKLVLAGSRLAGALFVNSLPRAGLYRRLVEEEVDVSSFKEQLLEEGFGFLCLPPELWEAELAGRKNG